MASGRGSRAGDVARWQQQQLREQQRAQKAAETAAKAAQRDERARLIAAGKQEADDQTAALQRSIERLNSLLVDGLRLPAAIDLTRQFRRPREIRFDPGELGRPAARPAWRDFEPAAPGVIAGFLGNRTKHDARVASARQQYAEAEAAWNATEQSRVAALARARDDHHKRVAHEQRSCEAYNRRLQAHIDQLVARERDPIERHLYEILRRVPLPDQFPRRAEVAFNPEAEQVVIQLELPGASVIPAVKAVRYVQSRGASDEIPRPKREISELYRDVVAQVTLLSVRNLFEADTHLQHVAFNGHVDTINPATGKPEYPCIVSLSVERAKFQELVLDRVSPANCLRHLNALVSPHPDELTPIQPILDFDLSKYSFVQGFDAVATLDHGPTSCR